MQRLILVALGGLLVGGAVFLYVAPVADPSPIERETAVSPSSVPRLQRDAAAADTAGAASGIPTTSATRPNEQSAANVSWARLRKTVPLSAVFLSSEGKLNPDERAPAFHLAIECMSVDSNSRSPESISLLTKLTDNLLSEIQDAAAQLRSYCSEGQVESFLKESQKKKIAGGPLYREMVKGRTVDKLRPEYAQAAIQVLSNPEKYAVQFDMWLTNNLHSMLLEEYSFTFSQVEHIQDKLFNRLANAEDGADSIRRLVRCAQRYACAGMDNLSEPEKQSASDAAAAIEHQIRTQRWDLLIRAPSE